MLYNLSIWTSFRDPAHKFRRLTADQLWVELTKWFEDPEAKTFTIEVIHE